MSEPDSPNDTVFYEPKTLHYPHGLSIKGDVDFLGKLSANGAQLVNKAVPASGEKFVTKIGFGSTTSYTALPNILYFTAMILPEIKIASIDCSATVAASTGGLLRMGLYLPDSVERPYPKTLVEDCGTLSAESTGVKNFDVTPDYDFPGGLLWVATVQQGSPTTGPTLRTTGNSTIDLPLPAATDLANSCPGLSGVTGALPAEVAFASLIWTAAVWPIVGVRKA